MGGLSLFFSSLLVVVVDKIAPVWSFSCILLAGGYLAQHWRGHLASYLLFAYFRGLWEYGGMLHRSWLKLPGTPMGVEAATRASAFSPHGSASGKEGEDGVVSKPPVTIVSRSNVDLRQKTKKEEGDEGEGTFVEPPPFWVDDDVHSRNDVSQPIAHLERVDDESLHRSGRSGRGEAVVVDRDESDLRPRLDRSRWDHEAVAANDDENENVNGSRKSTRGGDGRYFSNRGGGGLDESYSSSRNDDVDEDGGEAVRPPSPRRRYFRDGHSHPRASRAHEEPTFRADTSDPPMMHDQRIHPRRSSRSSPYGDEPPPFKVEKPVFGTGGSSGP